MEKKKRTFNFTDKGISSLDHTPKQVDYFDTQPPISGQAGQLGIRVGARTKTWFVRYSFNKKLKRVSLSGRYPELSLKDARKEAAKVLGEVIEGADPAAVAKEYKNAPTMDDLWVLYCKKRANQKKPKAASYALAEDKNWENWIQPEIGKYKVVDVTPGKLYDLLQDRAKKHPVAANRMHSFLGQLFKPALSKTWIKAHPLQWIDKPGGEEVELERFLDDNEIKTLWPFIDQELSNPRDLLKLGLLTAQRPGEILVMRWEDIDFKEQIWTNNTTKTSLVNLVPLSHQVVTILKAREVKKSGWVFPSKYNRTRKGYTGAGHTTSTKSARERLKKVSGVENWTAHDLRRTGATIMGRLRIEEQIIERVLAHSVGKVKRTYNRWAYIDQKRVALQKLANEIDRINGVKAEPKKIIKLRMAV